MNANKTGINPLAIPVTTAGVQLVGPNANRIGLIISSPVANRLTVSFLPTPILDQGINLYAGDPRIEMWQHKWGTAIQGPLSAIMDTADETIGVIEIVAAP